MRTLSFVLFIATLVCFPLLLLFVLTSTEEYQILSFVIPAELTLGERFITVLPFSMIMFFTIFSSYFSYKFFFYLVQGEIFTERVISALRKFGFLYLAGIGLYYLSCSLMNHFYPHLNSQLQPVVVALSDFVAPLAIILASWIMEEAYA